MSVLLRLLRPAPTGNRVGRILGELARLQAEAKTRRRYRLFLAALHRPAPQYDDVDRLYIDHETIGGG